MSPPLTTADRRGQLPGTKVRVLAQGWAPQKQSWHRLAERAPRAAQGGPRSHPRHGAEFQKSGHLRALGTITHSRVGRLASLGPGPSLSGSPRTPPTPGTLAAVHSTRYKLNPSLEEWVLIKSTNHKSHREKYCQTQNALTNRNTHRLRGDSDDRAPCGSFR